MSTKTFDNCTLPTVCFMSIGSEDLQPIHINKESDYDENFIELNNRIRDDREWLQLSVEYRSLKAQDKAIKNRMDQVRDALISMSETHCSIGGGLMVEQCERKGAIQYSAIPQLIGVDLEHYRGETIKFWKITEV